MNTKIFSDAMSEIDTKYVDEALGYKKKAQKSIWAKLGAAAACLAAVAVLAAGVFQSGLLGSKTDIAALDNGNEIVFVKSKTAASSLQLDADVTTRELTQEETQALFPSLPVTARAVFASGKGLIGLEGRIGNTKMVISTADISLLDTVIDGAEKISTVNGISVIAGYFVTDSNSVGKQNAIYYATFKLGDSTVYVENAGDKSESENVKNDLSHIIQELINNGEFDLHHLADMPEE